VTTDAELKRNVTDELKWEPDINSTAIGISVKDGIVTLSGYVDSYMKKIKAERAAEKVFGARGIVQKIDVKLPGSSERTDEDIARAAADALEWNVTIPDNSVKVKVKDGWLTLSGEVDWGFQRNSANDAVCCLLGVKGVDNFITVKPAAESKDIKAKIESAFHRHAVLDARRLSVKTNGDKAILEGFVHSYAERREAEEAAYAAPGICTVENNLTINP
jgi:osmotically-inducible protein OsmY